jgi:fluoroacetyl-CoA thioesterase
MDMKPGAFAEVTETVRPERTAEALGKTGVKVFGTPFLVALIESASAAVVEGHLPPGGTTVGTMIDVKHLAATPVGMKVRAKATLLETDGRRFLFAVEAWDEKEKIAEGRHERFVVPDLAKFLARVAKKGEG